MENTSPTTTTATMLHGMTPDDFRRVVDEAITERITPRLESLEQRVAAMPTPMKPDRLGTRDMLTAQEIADRMGVHRATVWRWRTKKKLVGVKIGRTIRYRRDDVERLLQEGAD